MLSFVVNFVFSTCTVLKVRYFLQCYHYIQPGQKTVHILSHHWRTSNLKLELFAWLNKWYHINWIAKVGGDLLCKKGIKVEDYCNDLVELNFPLDTLGLLVIARMFHNHIAIILKERIWTSQGNNDTDDCLIFLIYPGGVNFVDTCTGRPSFLSDHSMSDLENIDEEIDAINLCQSLVEIVLKPHPARMRHAAAKGDRNCAKNCSTHYGLRSSAPKKPVKPRRNTRNSNKVLMNINLDSLLEGNHQKNVQKRQQAVVVVDSETETVESTDDELKKPNAPKQVESGSNKEKESTEEPNKENEMDVTETENNEQNVPATEANNENQTENIENNAMDVTESEPNKEDATDNTVSENNEQNVPATEANNENQTEAQGTENIDKDVTDTEANNENETEAQGTENSDKDVTDTEANNENKTEAQGTENSDKDVTDTEANKDNETEEREMEGNKDNKTGNSEPEDNAMDVNPTEQNEEREQKVVQVTTLILNKTRKRKTEK